MGCFMEEITLANAGDLRDVKRGRMSQNEVHSVTLEAMPDTGAWTLIINEELQQGLGLDIVDRVDTTLADGSIVEYGLTEPVEVRWKERRVACEAVVIPGATDILLGALPLEGMDLMVDPVNKRLVGVHGDRRLYLAKAVNQRGHLLYPAISHF
jgi:clan AA aspartic protease